MLVSKPKINVCSSKEPSPKLLPAQKYSVNQCVIQEDKEETSKQECKANVISVDGRTVNLLCELSRSV